MYELNAETRIGPLFATKHFKDVKDPCPVFDGTRWHKFGSGGDVSNETWRILHATASFPGGPWEEKGVTPMDGVDGDHVAAPGVMFDLDDGKFHMFVQTEFMSVGGKIEYLISEDGDSFKHAATVFAGEVETNEAGLYDPHPTVINGQKYLVYSAMPYRMRHERILIQPDVFLAKSLSNKWIGPWEKMGRIMDHSHIRDHHNQYEDEQYEWGIEGPQLIELPNGLVLLNATCFLPTGDFSTRQRVFFAVSERPDGPYVSLGPVLNPSQDAWGSGENGHAAGIMHDGKIHLYYQGRNRLGGEQESNWRYGMAVFHPDEIARCYARRK